MEGYEPHSEKVCRLPQPGSVPWGRPWPLPRLYGHQEAVQREGRGIGGRGWQEGVVGYAAVVGVGAYLVCDGVVLEPPVLAQRGRGGGGEVLQLDVAIGVVARGGGPGGGGDVLLLGVDLAVGVGFVGAEDHH